MFDSRIDSSVRATDPLDPYAGRSNGSDGSRLDPGGWRLVAGGWWLGLLASGC